MPLKLRVRPFLYIKLARFEDSDAPFDTQYDANNHFHRSSGFT